MLEKNTVEADNISETAKLDSFIGVVDHNFRYIHHIAREVNEMVSSLKSRGLKFDTDVIRSAGLTQAFSSRSADTGVSFESIHRSGEDDFLDYGEDDFLESCMQQLFDQLDQSGTY
jgi:methylmalonyl-CoA/ethylmalonyl-CoA epimerase